MCRGLRGACSGRKKWLATSATKASAKGELGELAAVIAMMKVLRRAVLLRIGGCGYNRRGSAAEGRQHRFFHSLDRARRIHASILLMAAFRSQD